MATSHPKQGTLGNGSMRECIHACALVYGESGVLIRGKSGSGKSTLVLALMQMAAQQGMFSRLVCDDRVCLQALGGRLIANSIPAIEGLIEVRGLGLEAFSHLQSCVVTHVIDLIDAHPPRLPEQHDMHVSLHNIALKRLQLRHSPNGFCNVYGVIDLFLRKL